MDLEVTLNEYEQPAVNLVEVKIHQTLLLRAFKITKKSKADEGICTQSAVLMFHHKVDVLSFKQTEM